MEKITSRKNPLAMHFKKLASSRKYREASGEFLCEGLKMLREAVSSGAEITAVLTASDAPLINSAAVKAYYADRSLIDYISPLTNAQDILFSCRMKTIYPAFEMSGTNTLSDTHMLKGTHMLLDCVQDPGNVGTIIRTANAFGISGIILANGCADPYNPKTIRATMGAIFRQRFFALTYTQLIRLRDEGARFVGAAVSDRAQCVSEADLSGSIIAIGSEGRGLSDNVLALCERTVRIPIAPECESLNAATAAAIIMWEARRQELGIRN